jgi:hypothetical protein
LEFVRLFTDFLPRITLALFLVVIFLLTIKWGFSNVGADKWENTKELLDILLPVEAALVGSAIAFYFRAR